MVTAEFKKQVIAKLVEAESISGLSSKRYAVKIGINPSQWSRLKAGEIDGVLADSRFITLARLNNLHTGDQQEWKTVETSTYKYIRSLLQTCKEECISVILVDLADIGKTYAAKLYARETKNAVYIDCSQVKSKQLFVRELAKQFGSNHTSKYSEVYNDLVFYLNSLHNAIIIVDEAGDLRPDAFLELKALWNATEGNIGWFMLGADGLKATINRSIDNKKVGYTEIFRRYGSKFRQITPQGREALDDFKREQVAQVIEANAPAGSDVQKLVKASGFSLTNAYNMIRVMNNRSRA
jgi:DNA transposition AAA+ family ATPase